MFPVNVKYFSCIYTIYLTPSNLTSQLSSNNSWITQIKKLALINFFRMRFFNNKYLLIFDVIIECFYFLLSILRQDIVVLVTHKFFICILNRAGAFRCGMGCWLVTLLAAWLQRNLLLSVDPGPGRIFLWIRHNVAMAFWVFPWFLYFAYQVSRFVRWGYA